MSNTTLADLTKIRSDEAAIALMETQLAADTAVAVADSQPTTVTPPPPPALYLPTTDGSISSADIPSVIAVDWNFKTLTGLPKALVPSWFGNTGKQNATTMLAANVSLVEEGLQLALTASATGAIVSSNPSDGQHASGAGYQVAPTAEYPVYIEFNGLVLPVVSGQVAGGKVANWPALWLDGQVWPGDGEIDVMEGLSGTLAYHIHYGSGGGSAQGKAVSYVTPPDRVGVLWTPTAQTFFYEGVNVGATNEALTSPQYILMENSLAISGTPPSLLPANFIVGRCTVWCANPTYASAS